MREGCAVPPTLGPPRWRVRSSPSGNHAGERHNREEYERAANERYETCHLGITLRTLGLEKITASEEMQ